MLLAAIIVSFVLGVVITLVVEWWFAQRWFSHKPCLFPPYKQQHSKVELPKVTSISLFNNDII